jgi:BirA family biotin operon repressor/biotin-[acetyl-CoA-carboxylase] ligase
LPTESSEQTNEELILALLVDAGDELISGEALSGKLGLSRTAVWKHVESLRRKGYRIEAIPARGYRLVEVPDRVSPLELSPLLNTSEIGREIHYYETVESTNDLAFQLATEGALHGEVVIAERQTHGKGRRGRTWVSPARLNLYCSVILRPELHPQRAPELTLVAAVALAETLRQTGVDAWLKWPNDVHIQGRKVAGIRFAVMGIGVNLNSTAADFPPDVAGTAVSVCEARQRRVPRALFTASLWTALEAWLQVHAQQGFAPIRDAWKRMAATLGQEVVVQSERTPLRGKAEDIDDGGALLVRTPSGKLERVVAGEVEELQGPSR